MTSNHVTHSFDPGDGRTISFETGRLARQADGAVVLKQGATMILATMVSDHEAGDDVDFLPLTVDYKENYSATGKFPGGFFKREGRPTEHEILICRLVDRAMRPLFPDDYHSSTVLTIRLISAEKGVNPDALACLAASAATMVSDVPFAGPVSEVKVGRINGEFILNPTIDQVEESDLDMVIAGTADNVMMVEGEMKEISEAEMVEAINFAHAAIKTQCQAQLDFVAKLPQGNAVREYDHEKKNEELANKIKELCWDKCAAVAAEGIDDKAIRSEKFKAIKDEMKEALGEEVVEENEFLINQYFKKVHKDAVRTTVLDSRKRLDGRSLDEIRPIWTAVDYLPSAHGSSLFTRGETQSLTSVTLGTKMDTQLIDGAVIEGNRKFMLHYNFPPFSTGEARTPRGTSRREVGHGNLAERALKGQLPEDVPYTIRVVSDILESNGSSSMATVCAGSMALMDAGVKVKKPVSGIAMGLMTKDGKYAILSDILGDEDFIGDMDFKVTGTKDGITATQMDIKVDGLSAELLSEALEQAKRGRLHILDKMNETITEAAGDYKPHAPRISTLRVAKEFIGAIIGPGGKVIQEIQAETGSTIHIEEIDDVGVVEISADNKESLDAALNRIKGITAVPEVGESYDAIVKSVMPYGAFVEFLPGRQGLLHISEISWKRLESMEGVLNEGDEVKVKLTDIDKQGRYKLSRKVLLPKPEAEQQN